MSGHKPVFIEGLWISENDPKDYAFKEGKVDGRPAYQYEILSQAVKACQKLGRTRTVIDGGAHIGLWTIHLMLVFKETIAFEPIPHNFEALGLNVDHYKGEGVTVYNAALSDHEGVLRMANRGRKSFKYWAQEDGELTIPCHKLDTFNYQDVDLIKLDVENHELAVLRGAVETIKRCKPVIVIEEKHDEKKRATAMLKDLGMEIVAQKKHDYVFVWR